jgi:hypothetical protein
MWSATSPTPREMDLLMKRVLALHIDMTKLERQFVTEGEAVTA